MKSVRQLDYFRNIKQVREFEFGIFYFFDGLLISEMNEVVIFRWKMAEKDIRAAYEVLGKDVPIGYISNHINSYYIVPSDWVKFYRNRHQLQFYSVVGRTKGSSTSLFFERMSFHNSIRKFTDLQEAIDWSMSRIQGKVDIA